MPFGAFAFGSNSSGKLGIGRDEDVSVPTRCLWEGDWPPESPRYIASGGNHTIIVNHNGTAWAAGENGDGRCGTLLEGSVQNKFRQITLVDADGIEVKHFGLVSATWEATTFVDIGCDSVYVCGTGNKGELGLGNGVIQSHMPKKIEGFPPAGTHIVDIAACMSHTVAALSNGAAYGWGAGRKGQLGGPPGIVWNPRKIENVSFSVSTAVCGKDFTYLVSSPEDPSHLILGEDKHGIRSRAPVALPTWRRIGASWGTIYVLALDGRLWSWGRNNQRQLTPSRLPMLENIVVGSEHALAKDADGKILAWGWREHGNCGESPLRNGHVENDLNVIQAPEALSLLGAGCATSFLTDSQPTGK